MQLFLSIKTWYSLLAAHYLDQIQARSTERVTPPSLTACIVKSIRRIDLIIIIHVQRVMNPYSICYFRDVSVQKCQLDSSGADQTSGTLPNVERSWEKERERDRETEKKRKIASWVKKKESHLNANEFSLIFCPFSLCIESIIFPYIDDGNSVSASTLIEWQMNEQEPIESNIDCVCRWRRFQSM